MYHKKKIALFVSHIFTEYQTDVCQGIVSAASQYGYKVEVYATNDGADLGNYSIAEASILDIPNFDNIAGVIFASNTYNDLSLKDKIVDLLKTKASCPIIELAEDHPTFPNIVMENNATAGELTEHLITVHNAKHICFLGCKNEAFFSDKRLHAFEAAMQKHSLTIDSKDIFICDESDQSYLDALEIFTSNPDRPLDAIVCYNDRLALGIMNAAEGANYLVPRDFAVVGCDLLRVGQNTNPPLTSVTFPTFELGVQSVKAIVSMLKNDNTYETTVHAHPVYSGSCGCKYELTNSSFINAKELTDHIIDLEASTYASMRMGNAFSHITDINDGMDLLEKYVSQIKHISEFYLCLYSDWDYISEQILELTDSKEEYAQSDDHNTILLKLAIKNGKRLPECSFPKNSLIPDFLEKDSMASYIVTPLFFESRAFGYIALAFEDNELDYHFKFVQWHMNITQFLQNLCDTKQSQILKAHLEGIYLKDVLTGLYNHHGFKSRQETMLKEAKPGEYISAMLFDLDELKTINDHFGHDAGDFALKTIGQALQHAGDSDSICSRFSGDEFYCLLKSDSEAAPKEFIETVNKYLSNFNSLSSKPFNVSTSAGYETVLVQDSLTADDISSLFAQADKRMYDIKKNKIKHVLK